MKKSMLYPDPYPDESVEEIIDKCRKAYELNQCDKFKDFEMEAKSEENRQIHGVETGRVQG